jgi:hypothetical protein
MGMPFDFLAYGFLMAVLSVAAAKFAPGLSGWLLVAGGGGGLIGLFWGIWGSRRLRYPRWTALTLVVFALFLGWLNTVVWRTAAANGSESRLTGMLTGLMLFFSIAQLILLLRENHDDAPP